MSEQKAELIEHERFAFTPGPWRACHGGECSCRQVWSIPGDCPVFTAKETDPKEVVQVGLAHHKWGDAADMIYGEIPEQMTFANARLIAAAPDLYSACVFALSTLNSQMSLMEQPKPDTADAVTRLRAAILLATIPQADQ